nr:unnamed protein product [Callosobruchus analis]
MHVTQLDLEPYGISRDVPEVDVVASILRLNFKSILVIVIYIPPDSSNSLYEKLFESICFVNLLNVDGTIILGDFNIPSYTTFLQQNIPSTQSSLLINFLITVNLNQYNSILNSDNRLLNLVSSDIPCNVSKSHAMLVEEDIRHPSLNICTYFDFNHKNNFYDNRAGSLNFRNANLPLLYEQLLLTDWSHLDTVNNPDEACSLFYSTLNPIINMCVPRYKPPKNKHTFPPWFNGNIIKNIRKKEQALKAYNKCGREEFLDEFRRLRSQIKGDIQSAFRNFTRSMESNIKSNPKNFWSYVNMKKGCSRIPGAMTYAGNEVSTPKDILDSFADFFEKTFQSSQDHMMCQILAASFQIL